MKEKLFAARVKRLDAQKMAPRRANAIARSHIHTMDAVPHSQASLKALGSAQHGAADAQVQSLYVMAVVHGQLMAACRQKQVVAHLVIHHGQQLPCEFRACTKTPYISV